MDKGHYSALVGLVFILTWHGGLNHKKFGSGEEQLIFGQCLETGAFLVVHGSTLYGCQKECAKRKKCKSVNYIRGYPLCILNDADLSNSSILACPGYAYMRISEENLLRPNNCSSCGDHEVCENGTQCAIKECSDLLPSSNGFILGNRRVVGSKRIHVCNVGYRLSTLANTASETVVCNQTGAWEPDIHECVRTTKEYYNPQKGGSPAYTLHNLYADGFDIVDKTSIYFLCKVTNDFHILLKQDENEYYSNVIEIVLGGWGNSMSVIRNAQQGTNRDTYQESPTDNVVDSYSIYCE